MKTFRLLAIFAALNSLIACAQSGAISSAPQQPSLPVAFPGAEGYGKYTTGGREGKVYIVTNLDDHGPGSFREAAEAKDKRMIVFEVSGIIHLESKLNIRGNATIAGQSAPGDGICIADHPVSIIGDNVIVRYMRFRMGDKNQKGGMVDGNGGDDAFGAVRRNHIIIDHCSMSWSTDEVFSVYGGDSTTLQWNMISEPLNYSYHFESGDKDYEHHGFGGIWGGTHLSAHHNLFAHCVSRNPRFNGTRLGATTEFADFRNNVIYNWGNNNIYGGEAGQYNIINNYFRYGPSTSKSVRYRICNPSRTESLDYGKWFVDGNYVEESRENTDNNLMGIDMPKEATEDDKKRAVVTTAHQSAFMPTESAIDAFKNVLLHAGASYHRDTLDQRIINDVKNRTGRFIDVQGGYPHGTEYAQTVKAWPAMFGLEAPMDTDRDGMPDEWEKKHGLDPLNPSDGSTYKLSKMYTNIEVYLNGILIDK